MVLTMRKVIAINSYRLTDTIDINQKVIKIPQGGDEKRGQMPRPPSTLQHFCKNFNVRFFGLINVFFSNSARILLRLRAATTCTSLWF